ncbi:MAG TPA: 3-dehydroquinate synthase [Clostridiales bacterium]|jgi:3-dehydroquinate synthase|nr:3-dehydroquinate synthase [Clostridiales bacterium]HRT81888.1 3-dehydroquinate synthase [Oscillospiraceae bacterium]
MKKVRVKATKEEYDVLIGSGLLKSCPSVIEEHFGRPALAIVSDDRVYELYGSELEADLKNHGFKTVSFIFPRGEASKSLENYARLTEFLAENKLTRSDMILALGGGVVGDLAGFAAASYLRGIRFIQLPTTLLAAVDSSVGGKTGVNLKAGKNLVGAFWQPSLVICDTDTLKTLEPEIMADGLAETVKYGMIKDKELFELMRQTDDISDRVGEIIKRCVEIKADVVRADEFDLGERQLLNFGHTLGHAIEKLSDYKISHGHAVAVGMVLVTRASEALGLAEENSLVLLEETLKKHSLPLDCPYSPNELCDIALSDKKRSGETINLIITEKIGSARIHKIKIEELEDFIARGINI